MAGAVCVLREKFTRIRALGLLYGGGNGRRSFGAMNLVARVDQDRLRGKAFDGGGVVCGEGLDGATAFGTPMIGFQSGQNETGGHPLYIPFPRPWNGLIEIVDVEYQASIGGFVAAEIL